MTDNKKTLFLANSKEKYYFQKLIEKKNFLIQSILRKKIKRLLTSY